MGITINKNGSANLEIKWNAYSQGANPASGLILYWKSMETVAITGATQASPCVITATSHGLSTGDTRRITDIVGMIELNDEDYKVTVIDSDSLSLEGVDSTAYTAYTSGGVISPGPIVSTDNAVKLAVDSTSHTLEGVVSDMVYRFGLAAYKTTLSGMAVGTIRDHSTWRKVQASSSVKFTGKIYEATGARQIIDDDGQNVARMLYVMQQIAGNGIDVFIDPLDNKWQVQTSTTYIAKWYGRFLKNNLDKYVKAQWENGGSESQIRIEVDDGINYVNSIATCSDLSSSVDITSIDNNAMCFVKISMRSTDGTTLNTLRDLIVYVVPN